MAAKTPASASRSAANRSEYLILRIGDKLLPGATVTYLGTAETEEDAMQIILNMTDTNASRLVVVQRRAIVVRRPAMAVEIVDEPIASPES